VIEEGDSLCDELGEGFVLSIAFSESFAAGSAGRDIGYEGSFIVIFAHGLAPVIEGYL
jgi:hypothetical protein